MKTSVFKGTSFAKKAKVILAGAAGTALALGASLPVFAADSSISDTLISSFTSVGTDMTGMLGKAIPVVLPIIGGVLIVTFGIKLFKKLTNKAG